MIDYEKLDKLMELPVSEEMLGAYIEDNLSEIERNTIESILNDSECCAIVSEINDGEANPENSEEFPDLGTIELPGGEEFFIDVESDNIIKYFTDMRETILNSLVDTAETCGSVGAHMRVGEDAIDVTSSHVLQSYSDTCAIKSQQLILERFGKYISEDQLVQQAYDNGWYRPGYGTSVSDMGEILRENGVPCTNYSNCNIAHVVSALADGKQIMMAVDSGELWESSYLGKLLEKIEDRMPLIGGADHALLVTGVDASDPSDVKVIVTDPGSGALNKPYPLKQFIEAAEDSRFFMTVTDNSAPNVFDAFEPGTTHLPMIGEMNYYEFMNQFCDYMQDGDVIPDNVWSNFKLSAFSAEGIEQEVAVHVSSVNPNHEQTSDSINFDGDDEDKTTEKHEEGQMHHAADDEDENRENEEDENREDDEDEETNDEDNNDEIADEELAEVDDEEVCDEA